MPRLLFWPVSRLQPQGILRILLLAPYAISPTLGRVTCSLGGVTDALGRAADGVANACCFCLLSALKADCDGFGGLEEVFKESRRRKKKTFTLS